MNLTGCIYCQKNHFNYKKLKSYLPALIQYFAKVQYNHVGILVEEQDSIWLYESIATGVVKTLFIDKIKNKTYITDYLILNPVYRGFNKTLVGPECRFLSRIKYDFINLFVHQLLWNAFNIWWGAKNQSKALKRLICYEVVFYIHRRSNTLKNEWWKSKPSHIYNNSEFQIIEKFDINEKI